MKKYAVSVIIVSLIALLGFGFIGTYFQSVDSLMRPPKVEGENLLIQLAFEDFVGKNYLLKQPISGNYRSAYTFIDLTGDKDDEVIVFYSKSDDLGIVRMNVLDKSNDQWSSIADFESVHNDIQEIGFADLNGDGTKEIIVGWTVLGESHSKVITVYKIGVSEEDIIIEPVYADRYSMFRIDDIDDDGRSDILSLKHITAGNTAEYNVTLLSYSDSGIEETGNFLLDSSISSVASINSDFYTEENIKRIFIDGHKIGGGMITDCIFWNNADRNFERYYVSEVSVGALSSRTSSVVCRDINSDGLIEVPTEEFLPNISYDNATSPDMLRSSNLGQSLINWVSVKNHKSEIVDKHIIMSQYGYNFRFDEEWSGRVSVVNDPQKGILTFWAYEMQDEIPVRTEKLFSIMTITELGFETIGEISFSFSMVKQLKDKVYFSRIYDAGIEEGITKKVIKQRIIAG